MERFTDKEVVKKLKEKYYGDLTKWNEAYIRLAELEDKLEIGQLMELPCGIGDKVYRLFYGSYEECTVIHINIHKNRKGQEACYTLVAKSKLLGEEYLQSESKDELWVLTREDAEQKINKK